MAVRKLKKKKATRQRTGTRTVKVLKQHGHSRSIRADSKRSAMPPGRRVTPHGSKYTETRQNRSDKRNSSI